MTAEAHIKQADPFQRGIQVAILDRYENGVYVHKFGQQAKEFVANEASGSELDGSIFLHLSDDEGRALYETLARHYGDYPQNPTHLREDYLAERARVDKLIGYLAQ